MATGISKLSWLGVSTEATPGTPIATPTMLAPTKAGFKNQKKIVYQEEERGSRDKNYGARVTTKQATGTVKGNWYNNSGGYFLYAFMGGDTPSQPAAGTDPTVWSHALTLTDALPSLTLFRAVGDVAVYQFSFAVVEKLSFKWTADGKLVELDGNWSAHSGTKMGSPPSRPASGDPTAFGGFAPTVTVDSVASLTVQEVTVNLSQVFEVQFSSGNGQQYAEIVPGDRTADIEFVARFKTTTDLYDKYDTDQVSHINLVLLGDIISTTYHHQLTLDFPIVSWDDMETDTSKAGVMVKAKGTAMAGATANSLFTGTLQNTHSSYTV